METNLLRTLNNTTASPVLEEMIRTEKAGKSAVTKSARRCC